MDNLPLESEQPSRFVVGMDLGTTNSAVAYVDTAEQPWTVRVFPVPQLVAPGQVEARDTLPSFHYQPPESESAEYAVGVFARDQGSLTSGRLIASAKSWLCHPGVDRRADILPWHAAEDVERLSPVEVSARYMRHVREAWDARFPHDPLAKQDFVLTLPASFDEIARELTVEAAARAGLPRVVLIEEPQAAFYAWIHKHAADWDRQVEAGQKILVCDIGGGTTDFTLIRVRKVDSDSNPDRSQQARRPDPQKIQFHRVAVGDHLILGGDNLDLALAKHLEARLGGSPLGPRAWDVLVRSCRRVKEELLGPAPQSQVTVHLSSGGAKLIGGGLQLPVTRDEVRHVLIEGFFPRVALDERPSGRRSGFQEFGLPYAADPAATRHLAAFLTAHRHVALDDMPAPADHDPARPDIVLFNGGVFESTEIRQRILDVLCAWFRTPLQPDWSPIVLENDRLDLAVARGAAYYGMVRRGAGVKITANLARTYYIAVDTGPAADSAGSNAAPPTTTVVCLVPGNAQPGQDIELTQRPFQLLVSQPVEFPLFVSSTRLADAPGELLPVDLDQMRPLPPIRTALRTRRRGDAGSVPVHLHARLTEIGTLDLWCSEVDGDRSWRLQFDVRSATQTDIAAHEAAAEQQGFLDESAWRDCQKLLADTFGPSGQSSPESLIKPLAAASGLARDDWPPSFLRRIWDELLDLEAGRRKSPTHEARWLNLLGYALRPGYGMAVDDWRVAETWRLVQSKRLHSSLACRTEWLILWRRIAGGLSAGQQRAIAEPLLVPVRALHRRLTTGKERGGDLGISQHEATEIWRLLGSLELLSVALKVELGGLILDLLPRRKLEPFRPIMAWTLGRLGARQPVYGPLNTVVAIETAGRWLETLIELDTADPPSLFAALLLARRTDDRYRDPATSTRDAVLAWFDRHNAPPHFTQLVLAAGQLDTEEQIRAFGESLPKGLRIA